MLHNFSVKFLLSAVQGARWVDPHIQVMEAASVLIIHCDVQSLGLPGQAAPRNTLQRQEWLFWLGPYHETARERGIASQVCPLFSGLKFRGFSCIYRNIWLHLQCGVINKRQYERWRAQGLAFEIREGAYQISNPSLLSAKVFNQVSLCLSLCTNNGAATPH